MAMELLSSVNKNSN